MIEKRPGAARRAQVRAMAKRRRREAPVHFRMTKLVIRTAMRQDIVTPKDG